MAYERVVGSYSQQYAQLRDYCMELKEKNPNTTVNGPQGWKKSDVPTTIIPPKPHPQIGRPPKKRKKSAAELADEMMKSKKLIKTGKSVTCKSCKQVGHNSRGCKSKKGGGSQQAGVAAHGSQQAGQRPVPLRRVPSVVRRVHGSQTTQSTPQAS
ncbi:mutator type transposase [Tanacetum coccineum]